MKNKSVLLYLFLILHLTVNAQINTGDSLALVDLYNSTNGTNWKTKTNWLTGRVSEWFGISVSGNRVVQVSLVNNQLDGTLPSSIGNLTSINGIFLSKNKIRGSIPAVLGSLPNLSYLHLSNNRISGNIPVELGNARTLLQLHLSHNRLTGSIPESMRQLTNLQELILAHNQLTGGVSGGLGDTRIQILDFSYNQLSGTLPDRLTRIRNLTELRLNNNQFTGTIPVGLAPIVCYLFDLSANQLSGGIPADLGTSTTLAHVNLGNNNLTGTIPNLGAMKALQTLELDSNQLSGTLPTSLKDLKRLVKLNLMNNQFTGKIPSGICALPDLQFLQLSNNQFTFDGMECIGQTDNTSMFASYRYKNQKTLTLNKDHSTLSLNAGGTLANNTYYIYKDSVLVETIKGDSSFIVYEAGTYWVEVTNDEASKLTLRSTPVEMRTNVILPLQWLSFTAEICSEKVCLQWQTENEINTSYFEIEKSSNGTIFNKIADKPATNRPGKHTYTSSDNTPVNGINYYRIKQVDLDGRYTYSNILSVKINAQGSLTLMPNPVKNTFSLKGIAKAEQVAIYNIEGRLLQRWQNVSGNQPLNIASFQQGIYIVKIVQSKQETTHKLVKQ